MFEKFKQEMEMQKERDAKKDVLKEHGVKSIDAKDYLMGLYKDPLPEPYIIVRDQPGATFQNAMGISFNNLAAAINLLAKEHGYKILSTACDNHTMYVFMEKLR